MNNAYQTYRTINVDTASQGKLILIAYDVAIKHCKMALETFGNTKRIEERSRHLFKAQDAISELMSALKLDVGEIAHRLYALYDYMLRRLVESNIKDDRSHTEEILSYLETLRDAWTEAVTKTNCKKEMVSQQGFAISG